MTDILFTREKGNAGDIGVVTLNRPKALNALTFEMIMQLSQQLQQWQNDSTIKAVVVKSNSEKAFCAGGDIRRIYELAKAGDSSCVDFFYHEYQLNYLSHQYSKPYISFLDGITMGGGVGISLHGSHPIGTENITFAMPETGIGFFPDVGGSYFLSRCSHEYGAYLGLTGARINIDAVLEAGLISHYVPNEKLPALFEQLLQTEFSSDAKQSVSDIVDTFSRPSSENLLTEQRELIAECFSADDMELITKNLTAKNTPWSEKTLQQLNKKSPTSLKVTLRQIREGKKLDFAKCMQMEYRLVNRFISGHDFYEGVRAVLIDKDQNANWQPNNFSEVSSDTVEHFFSKIAEKDLPIGN